MSVPSLTIADAVVASLNGATLSQDVTFARAYVPKFDMSSATAVVQGKVIPVSDAREMGSAAADNAAIAVDVGIMKKLQSTAAAAEQVEIDALLELCEEVKSVLNRQRLPTATGFICTAVVQEPIYSVESIENDRVFLAAPRFTFLTTVSV